MSSSSAQISISGSFKNALEISLFSRDNKNEGNNTKLERYETISANEISNPNAEVPPKLDAIKIPNPKNSIIAV